MVGGYGHGRGTRKAEAPCCVCPLYLQVAHDPPTASTSRKQGGETWKVPCGPSLSRETVGHGKWD